MPIQQDKIRRRNYTFEAMEPEFNAKSIQFQMQLVANIREL